MTALALMFTGLMIVGGIGGIVGRVLDDDVIRNLGWLFFMLGLLSVGTIGAFTL